MAGQVAPLPPLPSPPAYGASVSAAPPPTTTRLHGGEPTAGAAAAGGGTAGAVVGVAGVARGSMTHGSMASQDDRRGGHSARWSPAALWAVALVALAGLAAFAFSVVVLARSGDQAPRAGARSDTRSLLAAADAGVEAETEMTEPSARAGAGQGQGPVPGEGQAQAGSWQRSLSSRVARAVSDGWAGRGL